MKSEDGSQVPGVERQWARGKRQVFSCFLLLAFCFLLLSSGCAYKKGGVTALPTEYPEVSDDTIVNSLIWRNKRIKNLKGIANIHLVSNNIIQKVKEVIIVDENSHIRLESLNIMGQPSLIMVSDESVLTIYNIDENKFYRGAASPEIISKMTGIYMSPADIADLLTGRQFIENHPAAGLSHTDKNGLHILKTKLGEDKFYDEIWIEPVNLSPVTAKRYDDSGRIVRTVTFSDYRKIGDYLFPFKIGTVIPSQGLSITIEYIKVELNEGIENSIFSLDLPDDAEAVNPN